MPSAVLEVAALAATRVVQGPQTIGALGRRGRAHPVAPEQAVADEEVGALLEAQVGRGLREGVPVRGAAIGRRSAGQGLELLGGREIRGRRQDRSALLGRHRGHCHVRQARDDKGPEDQTFQALPQADDRTSRAPPRAEGNRHSTYWNTASGLSRLSEPSNAKVPRSSAPTTFSIVLVCSSRASIAACTRALPLGLSSPIIWS